MNLAPARADMEKTEVNIEKKMVSPAMAEALLETNPNNRPVSHSRVLRFAADMRNGRWQQNGETIIISATGKLLDGQHRLYAIMELARSVEMIIVEGVADSSFQTIDTGRGRVGSDIAAMAGYENPMVPVAAAGIIWRMWHNITRRDTCPPQIALKIMERYPSINKWGKFVSNRAGGKRVAPGTSLLSSLVYLEDIAQEPGVAARLYRGLTVGSGLDEGDPILALRNRLISMRTERHIMNVTTTWGLFARTLNAIEAGEALTRLQAAAGADLLIRPKLWDEHVEKLPKAKRLDDLRGLQTVDRKTRETFSETVKTHKEQAGMQS